MVGELDEIPPAASGCADEHAGWCLSGHASRTSYIVMPERRSFPQGRDGDQLHALAMNAVFDKEFGCSIQVRAGGSQKAFRSRRRSK